MSYGFEIMSFFCSSPMTVFHACSLTMEKELGWPFLNEKWCSKHVRPCEQVYSLVFKCKWNPTNAHCPTNHFSLKTTETQVKGFWTSASHLVCCVGFLLMQNHHLMKGMEEAGRSNKFHQKQDDRIKWNSLSSELKNI